MRVDPRDRAQLAETPVPLSRVLALFRPHRAAGGRRRRDHRRDQHRRARPALPRARGGRRRPAAAGLAAAAARRRRDGRRRGRDPAARRRADLAVDAGRPAGDARAAHLGLRAPAAPVARLLHPHPRRRGAVAPHQRRQRDAGRRHLDRHVDRLEPHHRRRHHRRDGRAVVAAVAALAARHPAGPVADPQGRPAPPRGDRRPAAAPGRPQPPDRGGPVGQRRAARQDPRHLGAHRRAVRRRPRTSSSTSSCARSWPGAGGWRRCRSSSP